MCGFNRKSEGDWSDSAVVTNTDRTQQTIELINRIEILEKQLEIAVKGLKEIEEYADGNRDSAMATFYLNKLRS